MFLRDRRVGVLIVGIIWVTSQIGFSNVKHDYCASQWYKYQTTKGGFEDSKVAIWIWEKKEVEDHWKSFKTEPQNIARWGWHENSQCEEIMGRSRRKERRLSSVFDASASPRYPTPPALLTRFGAFWLQLAPMSHALAGQHFSSYEEVKTGSMNGTL